MYIVSEETRCWACNSLVPANATVCPNCDMPLEESKDHIEDIDSFLDDLSDTSNPESETPAIPSFEEGPAIPSFDESPAVPSFEEGPAIPSMDDEPSIPSMEVSGSEIEQEMDLPDMSSMEIPSIPEFDFGAVQEEEEEEVVTQSTDILPLNALSMKKKVRFFVPQLIYWSLVFLIISFTGITIDDGNFQLGDYVSDQYSLKVELFIFGWISFIAMGWFFRYKSNQMGVMYSPLYGILYLFMQFIMILITTGIFYLIVNPNPALASEHTILTVHVMFLFWGFLISGLTFGFFLFFVGYKFYYDEILSITPLAKIKY